MTVILMLSTLLLFLAADYFVQRRRQTRAVEKLQPFLRRAFDLPEGTSLATNHTWLRPDGQGNIIIGLDELIGKMIGAADEIILPPIDTSVARAATPVTFIAQGKKLNVALPVSGHVAEVNAYAKSHPGLSVQDPYGKGWLVKIRPTGSTPTNGLSTLKGEQARAWLKEQLQEMKEFFVANMPSPQFATIQDGGLPADGLLQQHEQEVWRAFQESFVTLLPTEPLNKTDRRGV
jgi:glycine cleavage system H protein